MLFANKKKMTLWITFFVIVHRNTPMEIVQNFTRAGLFISRFYPKVCELCPIQIWTKQCNLSANTMLTTFTSLHHVYQIFIHTKKTQQKLQIGAWLR